MKQNDLHNKVTLAGLIITLGVVYGDIGTSPLYVIKAIINEGQNFNSLLIYGSLSCIFWTLTLQTTIKYVIITLRADNKGEGGIFALFALLRKKSSWAAILTMIGGSTLLADGVITPSITVTSSIEGLKLVNPHIPVLPIVLLILAALFFVQQFGTNFIGRYFGPLMLIWFSMLGIMGVSQLAHNTEILKALNPVYAYKFLTEHPNGFILMGAIFLCTTGAEALYSDLGHCGLKNIRVSWIFVKITLLLNYFGQGAWVLAAGEETDYVNPFYAMMPSWFLLTGIIISTIAAVIASQALISGSFTLISEAISLNFWPKVKIQQPTQVKGQVYVRFVNWFLWIACSFVVIFFKESANMEAAYGLSITITMIMTTLLLTYYFYQKHIRLFWIGLLLIVYSAIELTFLTANLNKFVHGGWFTIALASVFFLIMYGWFFGRKLKNSRISFVKIEQYLQMFKELNEDYTIPKTASNLVYIIKANNLDHVESKVIYSIFQKQPKRADTYWFLHVDRLDDPDTFEYTVHEFIPGVLIRVDFRLGFKVEPRINLYFKEILEDMVKSNEINLTSKYEFLKNSNLPSDFLFINLDRILVADFKLSPSEAFIMNLHELTKYLSINDVKAYGLDTSNVIEEKVPIVIEQPVGTRIKRVIPA